MHGFECNQEQEHEQEQEQEQEQEEEQYGGFTTKAKLGPSSLLSYDSHAHRFSCDKWQRRRRRACHGTTHRRKQPRLGLCSG